MKAIQLIALSAALLLGCPMWVIVVILVVCADM